MPPTRKTKKDGRKRTFSLVSSNNGAPAGSVASSKTVDSSPSQANGSSQALKPAAVPENPPQKPAEPAKSVPNVFEFLEENESSSDSSSSSESSSESEEEPEPPRPVRTSTKIQSPKPRSNTVPHGVLVSGGNTPKKATQSSPLGSKNPEPQKPQATPATSNQLVSRKKQPARKPSPISTGDMSPPAKDHLALSRPQTYYEPSRDDGIHRPPLPPSPPRSPEDSLHRTTPTKRRDSSASQVSSGYGLLASQLTKSASEETGAFPPLYRRFETVNHRVLLHLQDEISQMEEDLHTLDEYEELHRIGTAEQEGTKPLPASRRRDAQAQVYSSLHYRRMDLMSALIQKTEQYNTALIAYSKVLKTLPPASNHDITSYRTWMRENKPIAGIETRFLIHDTDLVSLTPRLAPSTTTAPVYIAIIIASCALLLPLLAFSMISEFSGRLVVVTVVGGAASAIAANYSAGIDRLVDSKDGWRCAMIYFGFMTLAAMFIP
ncbi:uncharacterized protein N7515_004447 [Penicillium bovifimosum]|uniref:DUF6594 domain-containing protein n=1 Tax=Penicillium bovifimosum TaxID=126998 RepID=A0A9W9H058_9EURO|nr:uncharacterized protein N7515_004447 [Penicillium bovifimosum]KAJ5135169.1 hypothetical protein N7515_004447 [Penicillium bovifimosum]